jgi:hypothetical protein
MYPDGVWFTVSSSNVEAVRRVGRDLEVRFLASRTQPARTYRYFGAEHEMDIFMRAGSPGRYVYYVLRRTYLAVEV